ncbi:hypothetical protein [Bradyrhizobium sp. Gha]|uniref:hypothetical protein n=1 Tax=Bradyrhizobium sp. Gha TaxID=1855318 RepID=UPI0008EDBD8E|nr:hypothetical protein [Bradyrhizobium sp. Gha]SFJ95693.1 DNA end-binding protein Ku [Bradyrhizobium sp. Gha]
MSVQPILKQSSTFEYRLAQEAINLRQQANGMPRATNVLDLMEALRRSVSKKAALAKAANPEEAAQGGSRREGMLMSIEGKKPAKEAAAKKPAEAQRKSA